MDAPPTNFDVDPVQAMLAQLAGLDMTLARHVHACAMATTETEEVTDLARAYQRIARSVRQSLALLERVKREQAQAAREVPPKPTGPPPPPRDEARISQRRAAVETGVLRVLWNEFEAGDGDDWEEAGKLHEILRGQLDRDAAKAAFGLEERDGDWAVLPLDEQIVRACAALGLPENVAATWPDLPDPPEDWPDPPDD